MKKIALTLILVFGFASIASAGWDKCQGCHNGKSAGDKAALTAKFKTADEFVKAAQASPSPMMKSFKDKEADLKAAAADLGLK